MVRCDPDGEAGEGAWSVNWVCGWLVEMDPLARNKWQTIMWVGGVLADVGVSVGGASSSGEAYGAQAPGDEPASAAGGGAVP